MTLRFAADENFDGRIVRGLLRILPDLDLIRVQDTRIAECEIHLIAVACSPEELEGQVLFLPL